jgi:hypothetical protein
MAPEYQTELTRRAIDAFNANHADAMIELGVGAFDWSGSIAPNQGSIAERKGSASSSTTTGASFKNEALEAAEAER